ncbi:MAG: hypothetical protein AB7O55_32710 [Lautropia sp.]
MAVNYSTAAKNARLNAVVDLIDADSNPAYIEICTSGYASVLATIVLGDPCGTVSGGILTFAGFPRSDNSADATGTAALARIKAGDGTVIIDGLTVGTSATDIILGTTSIASGTKVELTSATITHA